MPITKPPAHRVQSAAEVLAPIFDDVLSDFANGVSPVSSIETRAPSLNVFLARTAVYESADMLSRLLAVKEHRAHFFFEAVGDLALKLAATGFLKEAADLYLKLAAKMLPSEYGDKASLALTGADSGAVKSEVVTLTAE